MSRIVGRRASAVPDDLSGLHDAPDVTPDAPAGPTTPTTGSTTEPATDTPDPGSRRTVADRLEAFGDSPWPFRAWLVLVAAALGAMIAAMVPVGPSWLGGAGSVAVVSAYSWALAGRTGGRPVVFGTLAAVLGVGVLLTGRDDLATGASVMTCVVSAVLAVMVTVPAVTVTRAARECLIALALAAVGALATVGFEPAISVQDFEYVTFGLALAGAFVVVYRLGAGLHGLGRRGAVIVVVGGVLVAVTVLYAELLRRYGTPSLVESSLDVVRWSREHLGAFPRPIEAVLGIPALVYGVHMRARRRQGWWVCAFGVAATASTASALANPAVTLTEAGLSVLYGLVVGLLVGAAVIRLDLFLTGSSGGARTGGRRRVDEEQAGAVRPEPGRTQALY